MAWEKFENIRGPKGEPGDRGPAGAAAVVGRVNVSALPPDEAPTATVTGGSNATITFGLPRGKTGDRGPAGSIASASAESVPAGEQAAVVMTGTEEVKHAHFAIPRGLPGVNAVPAAQAVGDYLGAPDSDAQAGFDTGAARLAVDPDSALGAVFGTKADADSVHGFVWATVQGTDPVTVRIDGASEDRPAGGVLVGGVAVGDRVRVDLLGTQLVVVGQEHGDRVPLDTVPPSLTMSQMEVVATFPVRESGEMSWPQGFDINYVDRELYVANVNGTELRIDVRDLDTGVRKSFKTFAQPDGAFTESLNWHRNEAGDLCFIVWPTAPTSGAASSSYAIVNYTAATIGDLVPINGTYRGCRDGDMFVTVFSVTNRVFAFYVYDWKSVIAGAPVLLHQVVPGSGGPTIGKIQGIGAVNGDLFLAYGDQASPAAVTSWSADGSLARAETWPKREFRKLINAYVPALLPADDYFYEAEGATSALGKLHTMHLVRVLGAPTDQTVGVIIRHGTNQGRRVQAAPSPVLDGAWKQVPPEAFAPGWAAAGGGLFVRARNGEAEFQGALVNSSFSGGYDTAFNLTGDLAVFRPRAQAAFAVGGNTTASRSVSVETNGRVAIYSSANSSAWLYLSQVRYPLA